MAIFNSYVKLPEGISWFWGLVASKKPVTTSRWVFLRRPPSPPPLRRLRAEVVAPGQRLREHRSWLDTWKSCGLASSIPSYTCFFPALFWWLLCTVWIYNDLYILYGFTDLYWLTIGIDVSGLLKHLFWIWKVACQALGGPKSAVA